MSRKKTESKAGFGRLLDAWTPPPEAKNEVGCIATTFTFNPAFFEDECLARFTGLESDPDDRDDPSYLIEREEKFAALSCMAVLVDQHQCHRANRNLRWDLISARVPTGILHSKISLLHWQNYTRIIIASANLTELGYRSNREIFGVLDYFDGSESPIESLQDSIAFLREAVSYSVAPNQKPSPAVTRWNEFLNRVEKDSVGWGARLDSLKEVSVQTVFVYPSRKESAIDVIRNTWPDQRPAVDAFVTSPFFDPPSEKSNRPTKELWNLLRQRGEASITFNVLAEEIEGEKGLLIRAPEALLLEQPKNREVETLFERIYARDDTEENKADVRPVHLKSLWMQNDTWISYLIGSSNFTSPGLGLKPSNLEANLLYHVNRNRNPKLEDELSITAFAGELLEDDMLSKWLPLDSDFSEEETAPLLSVGFSEAIFTVDDGMNPKIRFTFCEKLPGSWKICKREETVPYFDHQAWRLAGEPKEITLDWRDLAPPSGFDVFVNESQEPAWWPVTIEKSSVLPPPEHLKDLDLDTLISILTSARPLHQILGSIRRQQKTLKSGSINIDLDPHKKVDTSKFLLQRTRRVSWALSALRAKLEIPVATMEILGWKLRGPVGVKAVVAAIVREAKSEEEKSFLLAELCLSLSQVNPVQHSDKNLIAPQIVKAEIKKMILEVRKEVEVDSLEGVTGLKDYISKVFKEAA